MDPDAGTELFGEYAQEWLEERDLSPKTAQLYEGLLRIHLNPPFQHMPIKDIQDGLVFVGAKGNQLRRSNFSKYWAGACEAAGLDGVHLHDLRHTGNTFAAEAGASLRELMNRMGHSSTRAAMVYLHARDDRARELADRLGERAAAELDTARRTAAEQRTERDENGNDDPQSSGVPATPSGT